MDNSDDNKKPSSLKDLFSISTQGVAFLVLLALMGILYRVNPFLKFTTSILKSSRYLYSTLFLLFLVEVVIFYWYDPFDLLQGWIGIITPIVVITGIFLFALVLWYTIRFTDSDLYQSADELKPTLVTSTFMKLLIMLASVGLSTLLIVFLAFSTNKMTGVSYVVAMSLNIMITIAILGFVYKILSKSSLIQSSPYTRLLINALLYIPCIFVNIVDYIVDAYYNEKSKTNRSELIISGIIVVIVLLYAVVPFLIHWIRSKMLGGKLLLNNPLPLTRKSVIGHYNSLNDIPPDALDIEYEYNYGISLWCYIYATSPSTKSSYTRFTPIFDYGGKPTIWYKADTNTLMITAKLKDLTEERIKKADLDIDDKGNVIVYKMDNVLLQKWNNMIINFDNGVLDIFYNGSLVKSVKNMVPYMAMDTMSVGSASGINGSVCNVTYHDFALNAQKIDMLYHSVKDNDPPVLPYSGPDALLIN